MHMANRGTRLLQEKFRNEERALAHRHDNIVSVTAPSKFGSGRALL